MASGSFASASSKSSELQCYIDLNALPKLEETTMSEQQLKFLKKRLETVVPKIQPSEMSFLSFVGLDELKEDVVKSIDCSSNPINRILLFGLCGSGKSHFAQALTSKLNALLFTIDKFTFHAWSMNLKVFTKLFAEIAWDGRNGQNGRVVLLLDNLDWLCETDKEKISFTDLLYSVQNYWKTTSNSELIIIGCTGRPWGLDKMVIDSFQKKVYIRPLDFVERKQLIKQKAHDYLGKPGLDMTDWDLGQVSRRVYNFASWEVCECVEKAFKLQCPPHIKRSLSLRPLTKVDFAVTLDRMSGGNGWNILKKMYEEFNQEYGNGQPTFEDKAVQVEMNRNNRTTRNTILRFFDRFTL